jgi:hypothetical protein
MAKRGRRSVRTSRNRATNIVVTLAAVAGIAAAIWSWSVFLFLAFALLPSVAAVLVDSTRLRHIAVCVISFNSIGLIPFVYRFWSAPNAYGVGLQLMTDVYVWLIIYSAAALGWLFYQSFPFIFSQVAMLTRKQKVARMRDRQRELVKEWGKKVGGAGATV